MTTYNHTPISFGANADSSVVNAPLADLDAAIGSLGTLETTDKSDLVSAINEVVSDIEAVDGRIDDAIAELDERIDNIIAEITEEGEAGPEVADARLAINYGDDPPAVLSDTIRFAAADIYNVLAYGAVGNGSTNDTSAVQDALDAAGDAGGGLVVLPPGTYAVSALTVPDNVTLQGYGSSSVIEITGTTDHGVEMKEGSSLRDLKVLFEGQSSAFRGLVEVDEPGVIIDGVTVEATFATDTSTNNRVAGIAMRISGVSVIINNCTLIGPNSDSPYYDSEGRAWGGIVLDGDNLEARISNTSAYGWADGVKISSHESDITIQGCHFYNNNRDGIDCYYSVDSHIVIDGCIFRNNQDNIADFKTVGDLDDDEEPYAVIFTNNVCHDHTNSSGNGTVITTGNTRLKISGNYFYNQRRGISFNGGAAGQCTNNFFNQIALYGIQAVNVASRDSMLMIANNTIIDAGLSQLGADSTVAIRLQNTSNVAVVNNIIYWTSGAISNWSLVSALYFADTVSGCIITGNICNRNGVMMTNLTWTSNYVYGNVNINSDNEGSLRWNGPNNRLEAYTGSAWGEIPITNGSNTWTSTQNFTRGLRSNQQSSVSNNSVVTVSNIPSLGMVLVWTGSAADEAAVINYRATGTAHTNLIAGAGGVAVTTGALTGTTGAEGMLTVSVDGSNNLYLENRQGGTRTLSWLLLG